MEHVYYVSDFISGCNDAYSVSSDWESGQKGIISFIVPAATSECNLKITFDKNVKAIKVRNGKNETCNGKVCTFTHRLKEPLRKGQNLELVHRIGFESEGRRQAISLEFNGREICGIGSTSDFKEENQKCMY